MRRNLLLLTSLTIAASLASAQDKPAIIQFNPNGPNGAGLTGPNARTSNSKGSTTTFTYYKADLNKREDTGVWTANGFSGTQHKVSGSEFIHVIEGTITLADKNGQEMIFKAGDSLLIPRGAEVAWKKTENVKEYWVSFDYPTDPVEPSTEPAVIRLETDGPAGGKGLSGRGKTREYDYYAGANKSSVGVWETDPSTADGFKTNPYSEFMYFLTGTVTLSTPDGQSLTFHAGDAALVPRGVPYKWISDTSRKFWVIFDHQPPAAPAVPAGSN